MPFVLVTKCISINVAGRFDVCVALCDVVRVFALIIGLYGVFVAFTARIVFLVAVSTSVNCGGDCYCAVSVCGCSALVMAIGRVCGCFFTGAMLILYMRIWPPSAIDGGIIQNRLCL